MKKVILSATVFAAPALAFAAVTSTVSNLDDVLVFISNFISALMPILISLAIIYFLAGVLKYVMNAGDEEKQKEGRSMMLYGVIAIFVMISIWGLVNILKNTFNLDTTTSTVNLVPYTP